MLLCLDGLWSYQRKTCAWGLINNTHEGVSSLLNPRRFLFCGCHFWRGVGGNSNLVCMVRPFARPHAACCAC